ncbi:MAG TPA: phosphoglycolate phosphatase [Nevskiaceae bacterium]|nr:phosphoglycolate phosphatase [Nevskiaceae bacterium]
MRFDLILFDLDGTLIDSVGEIAVATNAALVQRGFAPASVQQVRDWVGYGARETMVRALAHVSGRARGALRAAPAEIDAALADFAAAYNVADETAQRVFPGVVPALDALKAGGMKLALVTNKEQALTDRVLPLCRLDRYFDPVLGGDALPKRKPDPYPVHYCLEKLGVPAASALFVGDSPVDVATARAAGVACWAVPWGYSAGRPIAEQHPDRILSAYSDLLDALH